MNLDLPDSAGLADLLRALVVKDGERTEPMALPVYRYRSLYFLADQDRLLLSGPYPTRGSLLKRLARDWSETTDGGMAAVVGDNVVILDADDVVVRELSMPVREGREYIRRHDPLED
jgi:hypothetical protein